MVCGHSIGVLRCVCVCILYQCTVYTLLLITEYRVTHSMQTPKDLLFTNLQCNKTHPSRIHYKWAKQKIFWIILALSKNCCYCVYSTVTASIASLLHPPTKDFYFAGLFSLSVNIYHLPYYHYYTTLVMLVIICC